MIIVSKSGLIFKQYRFGAGFVFVRISCISLLNSDSKHDMFVLCQDKKMKIYILYFIKIILGLTAFIFSAVLFLIKQKFFFASFHLICFICIILLAILCKFHFLPKGIHEHFQNFFGLYHFLIFFVSILTDITLITRSYQLSDTDSSYLSSDLLPFYLLSIDKVEFVTGKMIKWIVTWLFTKCLKRENSNPNLLSFRPFNVL